MERLIEYSIKAAEDIAFFKKSGQNKTLKKIRELIESVKQNLKFLSYFTLSVPNGTPAAHQTPRRRG